MKKILAHFLLPLTMFVQYYVTFICLKWSLRGLMWAFDLSYVGLFFLYTAIIGIISLIITYPSMLIGYLLKYLYDYSWFSIVCHSLAGTFAFFAFYIALKVETNLSLGFFWSVSKIKTILLIIPFWSILLGSFYSFVLANLFIKYNDDDIL